MAAQGYRAQLPSSVVSRVVQRQQGVGAAIAGGLQQAGKVALQVSYQNAETQDRIAESQSRIAQIEQQRARAAAVAEGMGRLAEVQLQVEQDVESLPERSKPDAAGYAAKAEELYRQRARDFAGSLGNDPEVQQHFAPMLSRWLGAGIGQARDAERKQRTGYIGDQFETSVDTQASSLLQQPTVQNWEAMIADHDSAIDMQDIDGRTKAAMKAAVRQKATAALFEGTLAQGGADAVETAIKTGQFDAWVGGADGKARWIERAQATRDAAARQSEAAESERRRAAEDALDAIKARVEGGDPVSQAEIETALAGAKTAGVKDAALIRFGNLGAQAASRGYARGLTTVEIERQAGALNAKRSEGKASAADLRVLDALDKELGQRADKDAGNVSTLWKDAATRPAAVAQLHALRPAERFRIAEKVGGTIGVLASLHPQNAQTAIQGSAIRTDRPDAFMPVDRSGKAQKDAPREAFNKYVGVGVMNDLGGEYDKMLNTALDLYVGSQADAGTSGAWNENEFAKAINIVFGASKRDDGTIQGGLGRVRGRPVELPTGWTASEFDQGLSRLPLEGAVYADGRAATKADVLSHYRLVVDQEGDDGSVTYRFEDERGRALLRRGGKGEPFRLHVGRTPGGR